MFKHRRGISRLLLFGGCVITALYLPEEMTMHSMRLAIIICIFSFGILDGVAFTTLPKADGVNVRHQFRTIRTLQLNTESDPDDTVRVRIWRALAGSPGEELTLKELGARVGERRTGELRSHLQHVQKQSQTLQNKNNEWKERRGLLGLNKKLRVQIRKGGKNELLVRLA